MPQHTIIAWMEDKPGVLARVANLFRRRNFNIDSLAVGHTEIPGISRMTFVVDGDERMVDQTIKQLLKLMNIVRVDNVTHRPTVMREMALVRVRTTPQTRGEIIQLVEIYRAQIVDVALDSLVVQIVGPEERVESLVHLLDHFGIVEMVRTGRVAMTRANGKNGRKRAGTMGV